MNNNQKYAFSRDEQLKKNVQASTTAAVAAAASTSSAKASSSPKPPQSSTNKIILDYLLYLSLQSRLKQARIELFELSSPLPLSEKDASIIEKRKQQWEESARKAEQDKNAVESVVAGILSNHRNRTPSFHVDCNFEQRLHLCQLTNLIFGRFDNLLSTEGSHLSSTAAAQGHVITSVARRRIRRHESHVFEVEDHHLSSDDKQVADDSQCDLRQRQRFFSQPIIPPFCRRHRIQNCYGCQSPYLKSKPGTAIQMSKLHTLEEKEDRANNLSTESSNIPTTHHHQQQHLKNLQQHQHAGLTEAIPTFLRTSADMLRRLLENDEEEDSEHQGIIKPMLFAGQKVMGGGMPPKWYDLFLELLTQAAIESYLCDAQTGLEPIFEIFSYGDVEDEDEDEVCEEEEDEDEEEEEHDEDEEEDEGTHHEEALDEWGIRAADHHLLFPKTRTMHLFKTQVREREKEFLNVPDGTSLQSHFEQLAQRYPLETFEKSIGEFIQMISSSMDIPALDKYEESISNDPVTSEKRNIAEKELEQQKATAGGPTVYKYPGDGSLLMPEISDEDETTATDPMIATETATSKKRTANQVEEKQASRSQEQPTKRLKGEDA